MLRPRVPVTATSGLPQMGAAVITPQVEASIPDDLTTPLRARLSTVVDLLAPLLKEQTRLETAIKALTEDP